MLLCVHRAGIPEGLPVDVQAQGRRFERRVLVEPTAHVLQQRRRLAARNDARLRQFRRRKERLHLSSVKCDEVCWSF